MEHTTTHTWDDDDDIETIRTMENGRFGIEIIGADIMYEGATESMQGIWFDGWFVALTQGPNGAIFSYQDRQTRNIIDVPLQGNTPQYDYLALNFSGDNSPDRVDTVYQIDTVYINNTTTQIDTVRELITERIFTSDTVYINETITLEGDVDTLVVNRTVTTRDTVYNFTEHTEYITRVDSVYLLGGDYLADLNSVTSVENQLEVEKLGNPYPNPASTTVSIDYVTAVPTANMFLGVYDNQGRRVEQFPVKPSHTITFDVSDWAPGVYVYMIWSPVGVSSTKRLVVQ